METGDAGAVFTFERSVNNKETNRLGKLVFSIHLNKKWIKDNQPIEYESWNRLLN